MNLLEAKQAYDEGSKIRHNTWEESDYTSKFRPHTSLGLVDCTLSRGFFGKWLSQYSDGWEIYLKRVKWEDIKIGQKFKYISTSFKDDVFLKCHKNMQDYNSVNLTKNEIAKFGLCPTSDFEIVEAGESHV